MCESKVIISMVFPNLNEPILSDCNQLFPRFIQIHRYYTVLGIVECRQRWPLFILECDVAGLADPNRELKAHARYGQSGGRALLAHRFPAMATVVLSQTELPLVHHRPKVPKERSPAKLAQIRFTPFGRLLPLLIHFPEDYYTVLAGAHQLFGAR